MNTKANTSILARLRSALAHTPAPAAAAVPARPVRPREIPNLNSPAGKRGIPAATRTSTHLHAEPAIILPATGAGATAPAAAAGG